MVMEGKQKRVGKILRPDISEEKMGRNPFIASLEIRVRPIRSGYVPDGEMLVDNFVDMEVDTYAKVFDNSEQRIIMAGLSFRALQVWTWAMYTIESGKDYLWVNVVRVMEECGMKSIKTYKAAIAELCRYGYIAPCVGHKNVFWINPAVAFKGNRAKRFPENVVKKLVE
jgi:hypothetical protein